MSSTDPADVRAAVADAHRREWASVLASTVRIAGSLDAAEECAQEAFVRALQNWERDGIPDKPGAWLTTTAKRLALDLIRRERTLRDKLPLLIEPDTDLAPEIGEKPVIADDRLRLVFTCCHPALAREAQVALTLRLVCGLNTAEIARGFLVSESTMAARVTRAKKKISAARIPYRVPAEHELPERLDAVLTVIHLVYSTGHTAPSGDQLVRDDLVQRAVSLATLVHELMPDEREAGGLLALMMLTDARRETRVDEAGQLILLADQDRTRWDRVAIERGRALVLDSLRGGRPGRFLLQACIAAVHAEAATFAETDWAEIVALYELLWQRWPSAVVALNRAVAVGMADGPAAGLAAIDGLAAPVLAGYGYLPAARADFLRQLGRFEEAAAEYRSALQCTDNAAEQAFLRARLRALADVTGQ